MLFAFAGAMILTTIVLWIKLLFWFKDWLDKDK